MSLQKDKKLNFLLNLLPEGAAVPSQWLLEQGYSRQLVRKYVQSNWLVPLGRVFMRGQRFTLGGRDLFLECSMLLNYRFMWEWLG